MPRQSDHAHERIEDITMADLPSSHNQSAVINLDEDSIEEIYAQDPVVDTTVAPLVATQNLPSGPLAQITPAPSSGSRAQPGASLPGMSQCLITQQYG
jgi:hypothetical protein